MAKKKDTSSAADTKELDTDMYFTPQSKLRLKWVLVFGVVLAVFTLLIAWPRMKVDPSVGASAADVAVTEGAAPSASSQEVLAQEMTPPPLASEPPPPPALDSVQAAAPAPVIEETPVAPTPKPVVKAAAPVRKHSLVFSSSATKVPAGLQKKSVLSLLSKKLNGNTTCVPASLKKKDMVSFTAAISVSKAGAVTAVELKPKSVAQAKAIAACIKKKLSGNPATFKSKAASKIQVSLKMK